MKIVTASEMRAADEATFRELGVPSLYYATHFDVSGEPLED